MATTEDLKDHIKDIPGDKSISHRAIILTSLSKSTLTFNRFLMAEDCRNTVSIFKQCGIDIKEDVSLNSVTVKGKGLNGLSQPENDLYVGNSGTGIRLITGILAGLPFNTIIKGDASIAKRPMKRVTDPLMQMGASISGTSIEGKTDIYPPLSITQSKLSGITYTLPIASAQVKSCILFAGLFANSPTTIIEPKQTRDHTEVLMKGFGLDIKKENQKLTLIPPSSDFTYEHGTNLTIPSDFSSAAFFIILGLIRKSDLSIHLHDIGLNPTRSALLNVLKSSSPNEITVDELGTTLGERYGDVIIQSSAIKNEKLTEAITDDIIPYIIDEVPILAVAAHFGTGTLKITNAAELRVKESDRITTTVNMINALGGEASELEDGLIVIGKNGKGTRDCKIETHGDHRIAMAALIAGKAANVDVEAVEKECIKTSFPNFFEILDRI